MIDNIEEYEWHDVDGVDQSIFCSNADWESDEDESSYDWATVAYDPSDGWSAWWTSADSLMCYLEEDVDSLQDGKNYIEETTVENLDMLMG